MVASACRFGQDSTKLFARVQAEGGASLTHADVEKPTPYNTYLIAGLPPGPIANPGKASLEAVANPARTKDLYFVADGNGGHVFSETYEQHQKNVAHLRAIEHAKTQPATSAPAADKADDKKGAAKP
jgi:UPF0755 protein